MSDKEKLLEELRLSRRAMARDAAAVVEEINLASKFKKSVRARPLAWLGGAAALGWILAGPKTRVVTKPAKGKSANPPEKFRHGSPSGFWGILLALFKFALPIARPALSAYAARRLGELAEKFPR
jgi:hypothetical protein